MARRLRISEHGVKRLVSSVLLKLDATNRTAARGDGHEARPHRLTHRPARGPTPPGRRPGRLRRRDRKPPVGTTGRQAPARPPARSIRTGHRPTGAAGACAAGRVPGGWPPGPPARRHGRPVVAPSRLPGPAIPPPHPCSPPCPGHRRALVTVMSCSPTGCARQWGVLGRRVTGVDTGTGRRPLASGCRRGCPPSRGGRLVRARRGRWTLADRVPHPPTSVRAAIRGCRAAGGGPRMSSAPSPRGPRMSWKASGPGPPSRTPPSAVASWPPIRSRSRPHRASGPGRGMRTVRSPTPWGRFRRADPHPGRDGCQGPGRHPRLPSADGAARRPAAPARRGAGHHAAG
ncbi:hypothetical protein [Streptomyces albus]|uniref:hypothetical protein n=1 Tax=Streptomyces albus TaxID=1888 RepID=UPI0024E0F260|nr:hypothetical protein [Streptomyces albus]